jgi:protein involved in polysaccharide export with SLBB domain
VTVERDGNIHLPLAHTVKVSGLSVPQLQRLLIEKLEHKAHRVLVIPVINGPPYIDIPSPGQLSPDKRA